MKKWIEEAKKIVAVPKVFGNYNFNLCCDFFSFSVVPD